MADKVVGVSLKVDSGNSNSEIKEVNKNLSDTQAAAKGVDTQLKSTGEAVQGTTGNFGKLKDQLTAIPGPVGQAAQGVKGLGTAFKALLANPVGLVLAAIVATLALLYKAFTNSFEGAKKLEQVFAGLKAAGQALLDNLDKIGSAIVKVFKFDFSGAINDIKGVVTAATSAYSAMADLTKQAQDLAKEQRQNDLEGAERAKRLAVLREQASDESVSIKKRKEALAELKKDAEQNAKDDIDLAKRVAENKIAQLTLEKDGALKNADEINEIKIQQINVETENANELRRVSKQLTAAEKQEQAERDEAAKLSAEKRKAEAEKLAAFQNNLLKLQQENQLAIITDGYEKELAALDIKNANEKAANEKAVKDKQLTRIQADELNAQLDIQSQIQKDALDKKYQEEKIKKDQEFEKELAKLTSETRVKSITDTRESERVQLEIGYEEKLADAITRYKDDAEKLQAVKNEIDTQLRLDQAALDEKNRVEDEQKKLDAALAAGDAVLTDPESLYAAKKEALDAEQKAIDEAYAARILTEEQYNQKTKDLADQRKEIKEQEKEHNNFIVDAIAGGLDTLASIAGKQTVAGKALAVASTTIKTIQGGIAAFTGFVSQIPGPVGIALGAVAAAGVVASGIASVKKILAVKVPGAADSSGGGVTGGGFNAPSVPAAPIAPTQSSTRIITPDPKDIPPARTYMLESDASSARERTERLNRQARLGG